MKNNSVVVATYQSHDEAAAALKTLQQSGFDMKLLSIVGHGNPHEQELVGCYDTGDRMRYWGEIGAIWGGIWGLLIGSAFFLVPGIGPLLVAGPLVSCLVGALDGALVVGGVSAVGAGLYSMGIPQDSLMKYEAALKRGKYVVIAQCSFEQAAHIRDSIIRTNPESLAEHQPESASTNIGRWEQSLLP
jgi:hypothetical protein